MGVKASTFGFGGDTIEFITNFFQQRAISGDIQL